MPAQLLRIIPLAAVAYVGVFTGVFFVSGQIFRGVLGHFYAATGLVSRTLIASVTFIMLGNFICGWLMARYSPALVAPVLIACYVALQVAFTVLVIGYRPSLWIVPATAVVMAGCVWVSVLLSRG